MLADFTCDGGKSRAGTCWNAHSVGAAVSPRTSTTVSVVIPTYNGTLFLEEALESVFVQTLPPREIIVVDDASTDGTPDLVASVGRRAALPVRLICLGKNSGGPARSLNVGISSACGDFITVLEQDDRMLPQRIEKQVAVLHHYPSCSIAIGRFGIIGNEPGNTMPMWGGTPQFADVVNDLDARPQFFSLDSQVAFSGLLKRNFAVSNSNLCFKKDSWRSIGGFNEKVMTCTDLDFVVKAALLGPIGIVNSVIFEYRWRSDSMYRCREEHAAIEATTVRMKWASNRRDWACDEFWRLHWTLRAQANSARRRRHLATAAMIWLNLFLYGNMGHLLRRKVRKYLHGCRGEA